MKSSKKLTEIVGKVWEQVLEIGDDEELKAYLKQVSLINLPILEIMNDWISSFENGMYVRDKDWNFNLIVSKERIIEISKIINEVLDE